MRGPDVDAATVRSSATISSCHFVQHLFRILPALIPLLALHFEYDLWQLGALVTIYYLGSGFAQAPMGVAVDRFDPRFVLPPGVALMGIGYLVFAASDPIGRVLGPVLPEVLPLAGPYLVAATGTFVAGLGASTIHPAGYALIAVNVESDVRGRALGVWGSVAKLGDAVAPVSVALLALALVWHEILLVFGLLGVGYGLVLAVLMSRPWFRTRPPSMEPTSAGNESAAETTTDPRTYRYPLAVMYAFQTVRAVSEKGVKAFLPMFLVIVYGYTFVVFDRTVPAESFANLYFTVVFVVAAVTLLVTGQLLDLYDHRRVLLVYLVVSLFGLLALASGRLGPIALLGVLICFGGAFWGLTAARDAIVSEISPADHQGRAFGYLMTLSHLAGAIAPAAVGFVADRVGIQFAFRLLAVLVLVNVVTVALLFDDRIYRAVEPSRASTEPSTDGAP